MGSGTIDSFTITDINESNSYITVKCNMTHSSTHDTGDRGASEEGDPYTNRFIRYYADSTSWTISGSNITDKDLSGGDHSSVTVYYNKGTIGGNKITVKATLYTTNVQINYGWILSNTEYNVFSMGSKPDVVYDSSTKKVYTEVSSNKEENEYYYNITTYTWGQKSRTNLNETPYSTSKTASFYPPPPTFSFDIPTPAKWNSKAGIQTVIPKINSFQDYATQRVAFNSKSSPSSSCPSLFDNKILTAAKLNEVYKYLGKTTSYQKGEKLTRAMLNGIADLINDKE